MNKVALIAVALVAALAFSVTNGAARTNDASHCQYALLYRGWHGIHGSIYLRLAITPRKPTACGTWNDAYFRGGRVFRKKLGTGVRFCRLLDKTSSQSVTVEVFADSSTSGRTFCRNFHPNWPRL